MRCQEVGTARLEDFGSHTQGSGTRIDVKLRRKVIFAGLILVKEGTENVVTFVTHPRHAVLDDAATASVTWKVAVALRQGSVRCVRVADRCMCGSALFVACRCFTARIWRTSLRTSRTSASDCSSWAYF